MPTKPLKLAERTVAVTWGGLEDRAGYFDDASTIRRVDTGRVAALAGPRALLMQAAHPLVMAGLAAHSSVFHEPYERLGRSAATMRAITFGSRAEADALARRVRAMHARVRGELAEPAGRYPAGTAYAADDPELLMWVLFTLFDSGVAAHRRLAGGLTRAEEASYWRDHTVVGGLFGLRGAEMPATLELVDAYRRRMLDEDELHVTDAARERFGAIVLDPAVPAHARRAQAIANLATIALLPRPIRRQYGFDRSGV
jgi:uncharacterized protein (DUF2236 family)